MLQRTSQTTDTIICILCSECYNEKEIGSMGIAFLYGMMLLFPFEGLYFPNILNTLISCYMYRKKANELN